MTIRIYNADDNVIHVMFGSDITKNWWQNAALNKLIGNRDMYFLEERNGWEIHEVEGDIPSEIWIKGNVIEYSETGIPCRKAVLTND